MYKYAYFDICNENPVIQVEENNIVDLISHVFGYRGLLISDSVSERYNAFVTQLICSLLCTLPSPTFEVMVAEYKLQENFVGLFDEDKISDLSLGEYQDMRAKGLQMLRHPSRAMFLLPILFPKMSSIDYRKYSEYIEKIVIEELSDKNQALKSDEEKRFEFYTEFFSDKIAKSPRFTGNDADSTDWKMELSNFPLDQDTLTVLNSAGIKTLKNLNDVPMSIIENLELPDKEVIRSIRTIKFLTLTLKKRKINQIKLSTGLFNSKTLHPITKLNLKPDTLTKLLRKGIVYVEDITDYNLMMLSQGMHFSKLEDFEENGLKVLFDITDKYDREDLCILIHGNSNPLLYVPINDSDEDYFAGRTLTDVLADSRCPQSVKDYLKRKLEEYSVYTNHQTRDLSIA